MPAATLCVSRLQDSDGAYRSDGWRQPCRLGRPAASRSPTSVLRLQQEIARQAPLQMAETADVVVGGHTAQGQYEEGVYAQQAQLARCPLCM
jgi:hypothetical protein